MNASVTRAEPGEQRCGTAIMTIAAANEAAIMVNAAGNPAVLVTQPMTVTHIAPPP